MKLALRPLFFVVVCIIYIYKSNIKNYYVQLEINKCFINFWIFPVRFNCIELLATPFQSGRADRIVHATHLFTKNLYIFQC